MTQLVPAPWSLRGQGHIFLYRFSRAFLARESTMPASVRSSFVGGVGALMLVTYTHSDCGPYRELLLIPGSFRLQGKVRPSITRIVVSTEVSVVNGRKNWGIPKFLSSFDVTRADDGTESWRVSDGTRVIFAGSVKTVPYTPSLPIHSALIPNTIAQAFQSQLFVTKVSASGWGRPCKLTVGEDAHASEVDLSGERPLLGVGIRVDPFQMTFQVPAIHALETP
jgi:Acetoacetate decarboxylase (ADC)